MGATVDQATLDGAMPFFVSARKGRFTLVEMLMKSGAADQTGADATPLFIAAKSCILAGMAARVKAGASIDQLIVSGLTTLYVQSVATLNSNVAVM